MTWVWVMVYNMAFLFIFILAALASPHQNREAEFDSINSIVQMRELRLQEAALRSSQCTHTTAWAWEGILTPPGP